MSVNISFFLDWKEYFAAQEFFRQTRYSILPEKVIGGVLMTLSALWFFLDNLTLFAAIGLATGLITVLATPTFRRWASMRKWRREPLYHMAHTVSFNEEGIHFLMGHVESNLDWKYYQSVLESPREFLLVYGNGSFSLFPKRAFVSQETIDEFRALAVSKLSRRMVSS